MPKGPDFSVMDVGETITGAIDFARWLAPGVTLASVASIAVANYQVHGSDQVLVLVGSYQIGTAPPALGGSGVANASVLQQWAGNAAGTARVTITVRTSDNQILSGWSHQPVQIPN